MDAVLRAAVLYVALLVIFKVAGRQSLSELTLFDFVLLLIIGEASQQALLGEDFSLTNAILVIITLVAIDVALTMVKRRWPKADLWLEGAPLVVVEQGVPLDSRLKEARLRLDDVMESAREKHGLERLDQIKYAIVERNGKISIIPAASDA
ncbi:MAG TPA: YetF domain-containing protein [Pseudomonas sp.]|nr:YetF domain-containing protein [Pseudomonas sp.]